MTNSITIPWPSAGLTEGQWRTRMESVAVEAERLIGRPGHQRELAQLVIHWIGLAWPAVSAETVAASARASLLVGAPGVVVATDVVDQLDEIHSRLDRLFEQAQTDPGSAVVEAGPILLDLPPVATRTVPALSDMPDDHWLSTAETGELLAVSNHAIGRWRQAGRFGAEGVGWCRRGKEFAYAVDVVEALMDQVSTMCA